MGRVIFDGKTLLFVQFLRQAQILILEILNVLLWLKFALSLNLNKNHGFSKGSARTPHSSGFASFVGVERKSRCKRET